MVHHLSIGWAVDQIGWSIVGGLDGSAVRWRGSGSVDIPAFMRQKTMASKGIRREIAGVKVAAGTCIGNLYVW
jgi:hypothetical protein